jgi:hypothetical protein
MFFKMLVYAKPLDWDDIGKLKVQRHGKWTGENSLTRTELTDFCWSPRDDGIHFVCEELNNLLSTLRKLHPVAPDAVD